MEQQPLLAVAGLSGEKEEAWRSYHHVDRTGSFHLPPPEVSAEEIRSASSFSSSYYPPSIHGALVGSPEPDIPNDEAIMWHQGCGGDYTGSSLNNVGRQTLDEVEIRQLLIDHVGHHCCWGNQPAWRWRISAIEDCNVYVGTLETFIEERETIEETEPYQGGKIDGKDNGHELGMWELDLTSNFPLLFVPLKETTSRIPHSEVIIKCLGCEGRGDAACQTCNIGQMSGHYRGNQMSQCPACYGRGLRAHKDGSDTICARCTGKGKLACEICGSRGLVKCEVCQGKGSLLKRNLTHVTWRTLSARKVAAATGAASVPDEVFHSAKGVELCNTQAYQCTPAYFADSYFLNRFSSDVIGSRPQIPSAARIISERHAISVVPVTRVTMVNHKKSFSFYLIGSGREVYIKYYPSQFCWGFCCCLEWLSR